MMGLIGLFAVGVTAVAAMSFKIYSALPKAVLEYAERHGRYQGLAEQELVGGTRAGEPPAQPRFVLDEQSA